MESGDVFNYQGPAWDIEIGCAEFFDKPAPLVVVKDYKHFIVAREERWPEEYAIPRVYVREDSVLPKPAELRRG